MGLLTNGEKERLALDIREEAEGLDGRTERRCGIGKAKCEEHKSLMIL